MIELAAANAETHGNIVAIDRVILANQANTKAGDWLKRPRPSIVVDVDLEILDDLRRDPSGADLVTGKVALSMTTTSRPARVASTRRTNQRDHHRRSARRMHPRLAVSRRQLARVNGAAGVRPRANRTWYS